MTVLTSEERELLHWFADGNSILSEYDTDEKWKAAFRLQEAGLIDGKGIITGTAKFWLTPEGRKVIDE